MATVFLINPPVYYQGNQPIALDASFPPLGLLYLAAVLEKQNINVRLIDPGADKTTLIQTIKLIKKDKPILVGLAAMTPVLQGAVTLAKTIKKYSPKTKLCLGGSHISADPNFINRLKYFDFAVTQEAEITLPKLIKKIIQGQSVTGIHHGTPVKDLDSLPWPARHLINPKNYLKKASLIAGRGCPFNCYYCSRPAVSSMVRYRSPKNIISEMESLLPICQGEYLFQDDSLTINRNHTKKLCQEMIKQHQHFRWHAYTRVDLVDQKLLKLMAKAGCKSLTFGIETGNQKLRQNIVKKKFTNFQVKKIIKLCRQYKIDADGFFILGHPTETKKQVLQTKKFILQNQFNLIGISIATPFPGSQLWQYALKDKIIDLEFIDQFAQGKKGKGYAGVYPVYFPNSLTLDFLYQQRKNIFRRFYLRPSFIIKRLVRAFRSPDQFLIDLRQALSILLRGSSTRAPYQKKTRQNHF